MEVRSARPPANRAVAALQSASGNPASASPLISNSAPKRSTAPITRYSSFDALCRAQQKADENTALREELIRKLPQTAPRNDVAALGDGVTARILELLNPLSADAAAFGGTCRAVRASFLRASNVERVVVISDMVSSSAANSEAVQNTLDTFFTVRGCEVRSLVLRKADETTAKEVKSATAAPLHLLLRPRLPASWVLQLVAHMPYLTELDLCHVQWGESNGSQVLPHLFSDLHIATTGTLRTLKVDPELIQYWTPGWWRRHVNLCTLVIGSRYRFAPNNTDCSCGNAPSTTPASSPPIALLELPADYYTLMREDGGQHWCLELWCPLTPHSIHQLFSPAPSVSFTAVEELLVNMRHNERVCEGAEHGAGAAAVGNGGGGTAASASAGNAETASTAEASTDAKPNVKGRKAPVAADAPEVVIIYPGLRTMTVVDIGDRPEGAAETYQMMMLLAPELKCFNVCDTVVIGAVAPAENGKSERLKRGVGAAVAKNVN